MAYADYRLCDVCGGKAFYDTVLGYEFEDRTTQIPAEEAVRTAGETADWLGAYRLGRLGDWAVICTSCSKTHRTAILPRDPIGPAPETTP